MTATSQPYFVMELVRGVPLNKFCDNHKINKKERLELFASVCHALQHAHQKGIIHRDLKPSNILVTLQDGKAIPKVIDFGVAKAIGQSLTRKTIYTRFTSMIGTPAYMSPEQAEMSNMDIDTRSDIYSLGVLLYELLAGSTPFAGDRLDSVGFDELRRIIREEEPPRPSARLSTLGGDVASTISANRRVEPSRLTASVRGDLDWIVMKALDKDRNRRYPTANALSDDITRYLNEEPVEARPPSAWYRFSKFYKRNRVAITTASLVLGALVLGTAVSLWQARVATMALKDLQVEKDKVEAAEQELSGFTERLKRANVLLSAGRAHFDAGRLPQAYRCYTDATETQPSIFTFGLSAPCCTQILACGRKPPQTTRARWKSAGRSKAPSRWACHSYFFTRAVCQPTARRASNWIRLRTTPSSVGFAVASSAKFHKTKRNASPQQWSRR